MAEEEIEHLKIDWDRSQALVSALKDNLDKAPFADVKLLLDCNESFDVHQVVLSQYSRFLTKLFRNRACCKCKGDHCTQREPVQIHLHDVKKETLQNLLAIIYVGEVQFEDDEAQRNFCSVIKMLGIRFPTSSGLELSKLAGYEKPSKEQEDFEACRDADEENSMLRNLLKTPSKDNNSEAIEMNPEIHMDEGDDEGEFLSCVNCDFIASSQKDLYNHSLSCNTEKPDQDIIETEEPATCQFCQSTCSNKDDLASHYCQAHFSKHLKKEFGHLPACPDCGASFPDSEDLMLHIGVEHEKIQKYLKYCIDSDRELSCPHCLEDFDNPSALVKHLAVKHYANPLKEMFRFTGNCISCKRELGSPTQMLTHMALKHAVLYKVAPPNLVKQIQGLMAVERQARAALAQQKAGGPPALASAVASPQFPKLQEGQQQQSLQPTLNLACPLCEMSFKSSKGLTAHLVQHYLPMIEGRYQSVMNACPYCEFQHNSRPHLLHHIVVNHKKLADFVPVEVRQLLKGSGVFDPVPGINGQQQMRLPPPPLQSRLGLMPQTQNISPHPAFQTFGQTDVRKTCPGCDQAFGIQSSLNRHISNVHIKNELLQNCNPSTMQCKLCPGVFKDVRTLVTHVGISHGFIKRFIQMETQRKKTMGANHPSVQAAAQRAQNSQRFGAPSTSEHVNFICPICNKTGFPTWTTWKKHIFHHMSTKIRGHYENIGKDCPICGKHFESFGQNTLHVAVIHNKVFNFLPPEMRIALKKAGLTSNKNKRQINCPLCPEEKGIFGEMTFKQHLYSHCQDRVRRAYAKHGRQCMFCRFMATDVETTVQHIAIYHNKVAEFLPQEVLDTLKSSGVNLQSDGGGGGAVGNMEVKPLMAGMNKASPAAAAAGGSAMGSGVSLLRGKTPPSNQGAGNSFSFANGSISLTRVSNNATSTPKATAAAGTMHPALQQSPMFIKEKPLIYREGPPVLICTICHREDFKKRLHLKRHLLSIHFKKAFYKRFGYIEKQCPFCQYNTPCHNEALRHVAFTHKKLKEVMPDDLIQTMMENGVMELDSLNNKGQNEGEVVPPGKLGLHGDDGTRGDYEIQNPTPRQAQAQMVQQMRAAGPTQRYEPPKAQYSRPKPILYCPVCQREDFPTRMYLKRHILSHYMNDFKERYKEYPLICPYCNHPSSCVKHNMIHIAITHRKLKELLPENLSTQLMQNGVLEINDDIAEQIMEPPQMMMEGAAAATLEDGQGGDVDASGEEDMVTMMDPSMFMDTMMTEDQSGEALDFGGEGSEAESSPRKRQREAGEENGGNPAKRQELGSGVGAAMAYPGMKPDQEMVAPDLMYPNSEQVDLHTCMVCGTRLAKPHDMRRHTLTHYRVFLRAITAAHQKTCPLCNTTIKHSDKYLFHYFLTHRKFYNVEALPEQVKRHIGRSIESNLAHNQRYPLKIAESTVALEDDQDYTYSDMGQGYDEGDQIGEEGDTELDEGEDDASKLQYEGEHDSQEEEPEDASDGDEEVPVEVNPGSDDENEGEGVESDDFNGAADINSYPCGDCEQKTPVSKWQDHLYAHFQNEIKETYPLDSLSCDICDQAFQDDDDLWKHLAFQHIRILDFVDEKTQGDLLAVTTPIAKEADFDVAKHFDVFSCELCSFKCTEPEEMKVHCVGHYYQDLKEMCGSSAGNRSCIQCQFKTTNVFEYIMHLGIKHKKLLDFASEPMKDLFNKLIGEEVAEFMAKINEESEADMTENTAEVDDGEEEEDEDETAGEENNQALEEEEDIGGEDDEGEVD